MISNMDRVASSDRIAESSLNRNVSWMNYRGVWVFYVAAMLGFYAVSRYVCIFMGWAALGWNITHGWHSAITFWNLHMRLGADEDMDEDGNYTGMSFWEQVDAGVPWTANKKFFTVAPLVLCWVAAGEGGFDNYPLLTCNVLALCFEIVPKVPSMFGVRLFGYGKQD